MDVQRSPSPAPAAPQPNPETIVSQRYTRLQRLYRDALRATLAANSYENFAACFPTPAKYCPKALEGVWAQLNARLSEECTKDFEKICRERNIEAALGSWEQLIEDAADDSVDSSVLVERLQKRGKIFENLCLAKLEKRHRQYTGVAITAGSIEMARDDDRDVCFPRPRNVHAD